MKIIMDAMGGDNAPQAVVEGTLAAAGELAGAEFVLVGREEAIRGALERCGRKELPANVQLRGATEVVEIADDPATAFRRKKDSSLTVGLTMLRDGEGDAFVSAGSTGALLSGATLIVKRIQGIRRAAMAPQIPCQGGSMVLCDCGANAECTAEYLLQFAYLGSFYAKRMMHLEAPRVALLNIGAEEEKGDTLHREAYAALKEAGDAGRIRFVGNIEASTAMLGGADVVVSDGFSGNIMLKSIEGTGKFLGGAIKQMFLKSGKTKAAALLVKNEFGAVRRLLDPSEVGGTALLGISRPVIKAHGSSDARAFRSAALQAAVVAESGLIGDIQENVKFMRLHQSTENA